MNPAFTSSTRHKNIRRRPNAHMPAKKPHDIIPPLGDSVRIIPLAGVEEIGRNKTVIEFGEDFIVCGAGIKRPDNETQGFDYFFPNIKSLEDGKQKIRAIVITHG